MAFLFFKEIAKKEYFFFNINFYYVCDMTVNALNIAIKKLPKELQKEVADFVKTIKLKAKNLNQLKQRQFGFAKGKVKIGQDFDAPLVEFENYM